MLGIRPGEGRSVVLVAALFATIEAGRGFGEVGADTLVLRRSGAAVLPYLFVALGVVGVAATAVYTGAIGRISRDRFFPSVFGAIAAVLLLERIALATGDLAWYPAVWVTVNAAGAIFVTAYWTVAATAFDTRQAKRLFPLCTSAAIAGSFLGSLAAGPVSATIGTENLIVLEALLVGGAAVVAAVIGPRLRRSTSGRDSAGAGTSTLMAGLRDVRRSPLLRLIGVSYVLFAVLLFSVSYPYLRAMSAAYPDESQLATVLGLISAGVTAASLLVSIGIANRVYARFGVTFAALLLPIVYLAGFSIWLVEFSVATAVAVRVTQQITQRGLSNTAWSAFFTIVPAARRDRVIAFIDGIPGQVGTIVSGVLLLLAVSFAPTQVFILGAGTAIVCVVVVARMRSEYARSLIATLREGLAEQVLAGGPGLVVLRGDPRVAAELTSALAAPQASERRFAADLLGRVGAATATTELVAVLADPDATVRAAGLGALAALDALPAGAAQHALHDPDARVRAEGAVLSIGADPVAANSAVAELVASPQDHDRIAGLGAIARGAGDPGTAAALSRDVSPAVRAAAIAALAARRPPSPVGGAPRGARSPTAPTGDATTELLIACLDDDDSRVRHAAAVALATSGDDVDDVVDVLNHGSGRAQAAAIEALAGRADEVRAPIVAWAVRVADRATALRAAARAMDDTSETARWLRFILDRRSRAMEGRLLSALAILGSPEAGGLIRRQLRSADSETRAQAIEAIESLGERRLRRAIVDLCESASATATAAPADSRAVTRSLVTDPDPWVRGLALRTLAEQLEADRRSLVLVSAQDSDPVVRLLAATGDRDDTNHAGRQDVPDTDPTLDDVGRMLVLRRVPLFAELAPEDLQRIAMAATERFWAGGEAVFREADLGDELVVIVDGSVRVVHNDGENGAERLVRTYGPGAHIGELAVLREAPRAASVIAEEPSVRGLVIGGEGLRSILRERPEAAMAMLATLADRISRQ